MTQTTTAAELVLDIATYAGKTWAAEIVDLDRTYGFARQFLRATEKVTSRSGRTGRAVYTVTDDHGVIETNEGRRGRRYWIIGDGELRQITREEAIAALTAPTPEPTPAPQQLTTAQAAQQLGVTARTARRRAAAGRLDATKDARGRWIITL